MTDQPDPDGKQLRLERDLERMLAAGPETAPPTIAESAARRTEQVRQRPGWLARWYAPDAGRPAARLLKAGAALAVVAAGVGLGLQAGLLNFGNGIGTEPSPSSSATASVSLIDDLSSRVGATYPLGTETRGLSTLAAFDSIWVGGADGLTRIDPATGEPSGYVALRETGCGPVTATAHAIWFATCGSGVEAGPELRSMLRVDPSTMTLLEVADDGEPDGVGVVNLGGGAWYMTDVNTGTLTQIDETSGAVQQSFALGQPALFLSGDLGSLWVSPIGAGLAEVWRVDPVTGEVIATMRLSGDSGYLAAGQGGIWAAEPHQWLLARIDPATDRLTGEWGAAPGADQIVFDERGWVWIVADSEMVAFDPVSGREMDRLTVPEHTWLGVSTYPLAAGFDALWWTDGASLLRLEP